MYTIIGMIIYLEIDKMSGKEPECKGCNATIINGYLVHEPDCPIVYPEKDD